MKKIATTLAFFFFSYGFSQTGINYQAIIKNSSGNVYSNSTMVVTFSLRYDTSGGSVIYSETHNATSTSEGQISLVVGTGNKTSNGVNFSAIDFSKSIFYTTEVNIGGAGNVSLGTQQLRSVSSAYFAKTAASISTDANDNVVIGSTSSMVSMTSGIAIGSNAVTNNTTGIALTAVGNSALRANTTGNNNTAIGNFALSGNTTGDNNTAIGYETGSANTTGVLNTAIGSKAMRNNNTGSSNTAIGNEAFFSNTTGSENTALGVSALTANTTGTQNVAVGKDALYNSDGNRNTAVGYKSLYANTNGRENTALGYKSLSTGSIGAFNVAIGTKSLENLANTNQYFGLNVAIGASALNSMTIGYGNVAVGANSGWTGTPFTRTRTTAIGHFSNAIGDNSTAIGYSAIATAINTIQLGNSAITDVITSGTVSTTGGVLTSGTVTATSFVGDGSLLSNLPSSGANNQIWISHALFERTGSQNIASKTGVFNGYYYEFLNLKKGSSGISQTRATFVPPSHWGNGNYKVTLYFLTENANSGNIQVDWGIQVLTMSGNNVSAGNDFIGNSDGAFQYGSTIGAPPSNLTAAAQTANNKRPLQKYTYTYNYNFSGIDFATLHMSRYLNTGYSYSDTYDGDFYVVGIKIEKNY